MNEIEKFENDINIKEFRKKELQRRKERLINAIPQKLKYNSEKNKTYLNITYVMTWTGICGGSKIILQHANRLSNLGHNINIISHYPYPNWFKLDNKVNFQQIPLDNILCESIPKNSDLIIITYWREIYEAIEQKIAPVVYFEQGDFHLFDSENVEKDLFDYIYRQINLAPFVFTVSTYAQKKLKEIYNINSYVIHNAVNNEIFFPLKEKNNKKLEISMIGSPNTEFKRVKDILKALNIIKEKYPDIIVNLISPDKPKENFSIINNLIINPEQIIIGNTLRNSSIYICASMYESFCLPVLEALTCGCAVITTDNGGITDFCEDKFNCLIIEKQNIPDMVSKISILLDNENLRNSLSENAIETSKKFSWENITNELSKYYKSIARYEIIDKY